jgi:hypothetical protein
MWLAGGEPVSLAFGEAALLGEVEPDAVVAEGEEVAGDRVPGRWLTVIHEVRSRAVT